MDTKALRQKILDLAIRGKLVPQDPNDEPASVLLERIRAEKQKMVKEGKLKAKDIKSDSIIYKGEDNLHYEKLADGTIKCIEEEIPFEIPDSWAWCRGISCFAGMSNKKPQGQYFDYIDIDSIDNKNHRIVKPKHLLVKNAPSRASRGVNNGSVLFSLVRPYLENIAYINTEYKHCIASTGFYVCNSNGALVPEFMFVLMISQYVIIGLNEYMKGDNSPSIRKEHIENWLYPIPPIKEQYRIIDYLKVAIPLYETIKTNQIELIELIKLVKSKILDLAIRGKLVPQDPNDEPASVLLERIKAKKEEFIKQGKIKRDKKESTIFKGDDNSYYHTIEIKGDILTQKVDIPQSWIACDFTDISYSLGNKDNQILSTEMIPNGKYPVISQGQKYIDGFTNCEDKIINDLPIVLFGDHTRNVKYIDFPFVIGADGAKCHKPIGCNALYVFYWMKNEAGKMQSKGYARHYALLKKSYFPLPSLAEQKRIVETIEKYFANLDNIVQSLI